MRDALRRIAALLLLLLGCAAASSGAAGAAETVIASEARASNVSAFAGFVAWSHYDATTRRFSLMVRDPSGAVRPLPAGGRKVPFDVDLGPGAGGAPAAVFSRCERDEGLSPFDAQHYAWGRGCRIYRIALTGSDGAAHRVATGLPSSRSTVLPTIWGDRIAFAARPTPDARGDERFRVAVYTRAGHGHVRRLPGGPRGLIVRDSGGADYGQGATRLDLARDWLAVAWQYLGEPPACRIPAGEAAPNRNTFEVRLVHLAVRATSRLLDRGCVDDPITAVDSPSISGGRIHYHVGHSTGDLQDLLRSRPLAGGRATDVVSQPGGSAVVSYAQDGATAARIRVAEPGYVVTVTR